MSKNNKRVKYGFNLEFPETFTLRDLRKAKSHKVKYITLYMRVKKALENGEIEVAGEKQPETARRGRRETIYKLTNAKTAVVSTATTETVAAEPVTV